MIVPKSIAEMGDLADNLNIQANDPRASESERKSSDGARDAVLGALANMVHRELNRPATATQEQLESMRPLDAARFFGAGGVIRA